MADRTAALGLIPGLLGLATTIGTAIPGLRKPKKVDTSRAASRAATQVAQAAVSGSQTGFGGTRGLALRSGLRGASEAARGGAQAAAGAAARDAAFNQAALTQRNKRLAQFGGDLGAAGAALGTGVVEARAAKAAEEQATFDPAEQALLPDQAEVAQVDPATGLSTVAPQQQAQQPQAQQAAPAPDPVRASLGLPQLDQLPRLAPELEFKLRAQNLALQEAERQGVPIDRILAQLNRQMGNIPQLQPPGELEADF